MGGVVQTLSDSSGFIHDPDGIDHEKLAFVKELKEVRRGRISEYVDRYPKATFHKGARPWGVPADVALPCATQNEISQDDAETLVAGNVQVVSEGANMPTTLEGTHAFRQARVLFAPGKAANAGGVAVSGLEQSQNSQRMSWTREEVDERLRRIMGSIHEKCVQYGNGENDYVDYVRGANIAGFVKVADALLAYGLV